MRNKRSVEAFDNSVVMQNKYAIDYYNELWPEAEILEIDALSGIGKSNVETENVLQKMDYSGLDKIVAFPDKRMIHLGQRFRKDNEKYERTFSLRYWIPEEGKSEYELYVNAIQNNYYMPNAYGFGITDGYSWDEAKENGFRYFAIYDLKKLMRDVIKNKLTTEINSNSSDKRTAIYFKEKEMEKYAYKIWDNNSDDKVKEKQTGIKDYGV